MKIKNKEYKSNHTQSFLKVCNGCGVSFMSNRNTAIWCGDNCKKKNYRMNTKLRKRKAEIERIKALYNLI